MRCSTGATWLHLAAMPIEAQEVGVAAGRAAAVPMSIDPHEEYVVGVEARVRAMVKGNAFLPSELEVRLLFPDLDDLAPLPFAFQAAERLDRVGADARRDQARRAGVGGAMARPLDPRPGAGRARR